MDSREARNAGPAKDVGQDGFRLIVHGVRGCRRVEKALRRQFFKESVTSAAGGVFQIGFFLFRFVCNISAAEMQRKAKFFGETSDKFLIGVRSFSAKLMIEMDNAQDAAQLRACFSKQSEQSDGIRAAGSSSGKLDARVEPWRRLQNSRETALQFFGEVSAVHRRPRSACMIA